jgi:hypothetical protein
MTTEGDKAVVGNVRPDVRFRREGRTLSLGSIFPLVVDLGFDARIVAPDMLESILRPYKAVAARVSP